MQAGEASKTARRVAALRLGFSRLEAPYGNPGADHRLQTDVAGGEPATPSPMGPYLQARTTFFDQVVVGAIADGVTQIVAVGAGYDGRSLRYAKPGVTWFELDHPSTQSDKRERLQRLGIDTAGIGFGAADFASDDVPSILAGAGHDARRPTLFTCEGVAAYLSVATLEALLTSLARAAAPGSLLAMTVPSQPVTADERARRETLSAAVARVGEPLQTSLSSAEAEELFARSGWMIAAPGERIGSVLAPASTALVVARPAAPE